MFVISHFFNDFVDVIDNYFAWSSAPLHVCLFSNLLLPSPINYILIISYCINNKTQQIIKECKRKKKAGHIAYGSLSQAIGTRLRLAVGDEHWKMACQIHKRLEHGHANLQKTKGYKKGQKLNAAPRKNNAGKDENSTDDEGGKADASSSNKRVSFGESV